MISSAYDAVCSLELMDFMKTFEPGYYGFAGSNNQHLKTIMEKLESMPNAPGHSGFSFAWTMTQIQYIARNGVDAHKELWNTNNVDC